MPTLSMRLTVMMAPWRLTFELSGRAGCGFALVERIVGRYRRPLAPPPDGHNTCRVVLEPRL